MKGRILAGKYRLVDELGRGGMGSVWRADHIELRSVVAVKLIDPALAQSAEGRSRFLREARAAGALRSNHVVQVYDYGVDADVPYLVMELLEGESLASRLERKLTLTLVELQPIIRQVGRALAKAHAAGIVHRDLKPENIFICTEGDSELVKVLDFGIAKVESNIAVSVQTQTGLVLGTPYYMSPEQAEGRRALDSRSDLWSLGVITFECLLGRRPFDGENLAQLILAICALDPPVPSRYGNVPPGFDEWFLKAVARRVEIRFANIQELVDSFSNLDDRPAWESTVGIAADLAPERLSAPSDGFLKGESAPIGSDPRAPKASVVGSSVTETAPVVTPPRVVEPTPVAVPKPTNPDVSTNASTGVTNVLSETGPRRGNRRTPLGLIVAFGALVFALGALVVWKSGRSQELMADPTVPLPTESQGTSVQALATSEQRLPASHTLDTAGDKNPGNNPVARNDTASNPAHAPSSAEKAAPTSAATTAKPATSHSPVAPPREVVAISIPSAAHTTRESPPPRPAEKPPAAPAGLSCVVNSISGRLQRAPAGTAGSFPCYVNAISGQLKRKN